MIVQDFLKELKDNNIELFLKDNKLKLRGSKEALTKSIQDSIRGNKESIIQFLKNETSDDKHDLSFPQKSIWSLYKLHPENIAYNVGCAIKSNSKININALKQAYYCLQERHDILRAGFTQGIKGPQQFINEKPQSEVVVIENNLLKENPSSSLSEEAFIAQRIDTPFNLDKGEVCRLELVVPTLTESDSNSENIIIFVCSHIVVDFWSMEILLDDLTNLYLAASNSDDLEMLSLEKNYIDFVNSEKEYLQSDRAVKDKTHWLANLAGQLPTLELPITNNFSTNNSKQLTGAKHKVAWSSEKISAINNAAADLGVSSYSYLFGIYFILLAKYSDSDDVIIGMPANQRPQYEGQDVVGHFVNTLPIRQNFDSTTSFLDWAKSTQDKVLMAMEHQSYPFPAMVKDLAIDRKLASSPVFQSVFNWNQARDSVGFSPALGELLLSTSTGVKGSSYDLTLTVAPANDSNSECIWTFSESKYDLDLIKKLADSFNCLIEQIIDNPRVTIGNLKLTNNKPVTSSTSSSDNAYLAGSLTHQKVAEYAKLNSKSLAIVDGEREISYQQLNNDAELLAKILRSKGCEVGDRIGILMDMRYEAIVAMLAAWKIGCAYIPISLNYPKERVSFICNDASLSLLLTAGVKNLADYALVTPYEDINQLLRLPAPEEPLQDFSYNGNIAYIIYTSGSTGQPKGVAVSHRSLMSMVDWHLNTYQVTESDNASQLAGFGFDAAVWEIWPYMSAGATLYLTDKDTRMNSSKLIDWLDDKSIDICFMPTPMAENTLKNPKSKLLKLKYLLTGGDRLVFNQVKDLNFKLINHYGPTENTVVASAGVVSQGDSPPNIGQAIYNTDVFILDQYLNPLPEGVSGQIFLGGNGLAYGYYDKSSLTAEKFIPNLFSDDGARLYATGDYGRFINDKIEFVGRSDKQVKIRGYRVELGEIQNSIEQVSEIKASLVHLVRSEKNSEVYQIVAYLIAAKNPTKNNTELQDVEVIVAEHLKKSLPDYMLPDAYQIIDDIPVTANGKVDYKALSVPDLNNKQVKYKAPSTSLEKKLTVLWESEIGYSPIGIEDDFFKLGGHSLLAMRITDEIQHKMKVKCSLNLLFDNPTIESLAKVLESAESQNKAIEALPELIVNEEQKHSPFPLTEIQQAYYIGRSNVYELSDVATQAYSEVDVDDINIERFNYAWRALIERHEMLRMVITDDHQQCILANVPEYSATYIDLSLLEEKQAEEQLLSIRKEMIEGVKTGTQWPLFDKRITKMPNGKYRLHSLLDALFADGKSYFILTYEFMHFYLGIQDQLKETSVSYRDYVITEKKIKDSAWYQKSKAYWLNRLDTLPGPPELPLKSQKTKNAQGQFKRRSHRLSSQQWSKLKERAAQLSVTPTVLLLSAYASVIGAWSKNQQFTLNLTLFNRYPLHPGIDSVVGDFTSLTLLEVDCESENFDSHCKNIQKQLFTDLEHKCFGGIEFLREKAKKDPNNQQAIMPVVFTSAIGNEDDDSMKAIEQAASELDMQMLNMDGFASSQTSQVWLDHAVVPDGGGIKLSWEAVDSLFEDQVLDYMFESYCKAVLCISEQKSSWDDIGIRSLSKQESQQRVEYNNTTTQISDLLLHELIEQQVKLTPESDAVITQERKLTYSQLWSASGHLATKLVDNGVSPKDNIAIMMSKGWQQVVCVLAILRVGAIYLPIDSALPSARKRQLLSSANVQLVLATNDDNGYSKDERFTILKVDPSLLDNESIDNFTTDYRQNLEDLAYIIFTSGTTGIPKGVMIDHRGAVNTILDINKKFKVTQSDRVLALSSLSFDLSVYDIFGPLAQGGAIVIPQTEQAVDPSSWDTLMKQHKVTVFNAVPALMQLLVDYLETKQTSFNSNLRLAMLSGDKIPVTLPDRIKYLSESKHIDVISLGGATEASIWSIYFPISKVEKHWTSIPYGVPLANQKFFVLRPDMTPCPTWVSGDLYIGGIGLAHGYWADEEKTNNSFITNPHTGELLYRTGDIGRFMSNGNIEFLGREDAQVKIQGYRIELEEIESVLLKHPAVNSAAAMTYRDDNDDAHLSAYIQPIKKKDADLAKKLALKIDKPAILNNYQQKIPMLYPNKIQHSDKLIKLAELDEKLLGHWLGSLAQYEVKNATLAKYYYPSAGSLNPVQLYLILHKDLAENLPAGSYYYHPVEHALFPVPNKSYGDLINKSSAEQLISTIFVAELSAIEAVYGDYSTDFCRLEAGYMEELLIGHGLSTGVQPLATHSDDLKDWHQLLNLQQTQVCLKHSFWKSGENLPTKPVVQAVSSLSITSRQSFRKFCGHSDNIKLNELLTSSLSNTKHETPDGYSIIIYVKRNIDDIEQGFYRYDVANLTLDYLDHGKIYSESFSGLNVDIFNEADFCIFFLCTNLENRAEALHLSGKNSQKIMSKSASLEIGFCPIGSMDFSTLVSNLGLPKGTELLHTLIGGAINQQQLESWEELNESTTPNLDLESELLEHLKSQLPAYMVPPRVIELQEIPLTSNGKVDRSRLPEPVATQQKKKIYQAPRTQTEIKICHLWSEILAVERVGLNDTFFELGGNSMMMIRAHTRLQDEFKQEIAIVDLFNYSDVKSLAVHLDGGADNNEEMKQAEQQANKQREAMERMRRRSNQRIIS